MLTKGTIITILDERDGEETTASAEVLKWAPKASGLLPGAIVKIVGTQKKFWVSTAAIVTE